MRNYTDEEIQRLISCPKKMQEPPRKNMRDDHGHQRNDMDLISTDDKHGFRVFMRINLEFPENFSIGLDYFPADEPGSITLVRYNGPHGEHESNPHHVTHHIHRANAENINAGLKAERSIVSANYAAFDEALLQFLETIGLTDVGKHFPELIQRSIWPKEGGK